MSFAFYLMNPVDGEASKSQPANSLHIQKREHSLAGNKGYENVYKYFKKTVKNKEYTYIDTYEIGGLQNGTKLKGFDELYLAKSICMKIYAYIYICMMGVAKAISPPAAGHI